MRLQLNTEKMIAEKREGVGWMTFNQPERRNAISHEMRVAIVQILKDFEKDDEVRVVVVTGAGDKAFVSGSDISKSEKGGATPEQLEEQGQIAIEVRRRWDLLTKPIIAMIRGYCLGGGLATALQTDIRIASDDAQFGVPAARLGNAYNWKYTRKLVEIIGPARTKEMLMTARRYNAAEALQIGLVHQVVPGADLEATVRQVAQMIAENSPLSVRAAKFIVGEAVKDESKRDVDRVHAVRDMCLRSEDYKEGRRAFMEKRKPQWKGR